MRGRLTRSVVDPAAQSRSLAVTERQKKKRKKEKKTSSKGCAEPGFRKPANFLGETPFFFENGLLVQAWRGAPGVGGRGGMRAGEGQKHQKLGKNAQFWGFDL